jgi:predicted kinase
MLIVMSGLPGSGKSALSQQLARRLGCPVFSVDPIESAMLKAGMVQSFETGLAAYLVAESLADAHLELGQSVIIDAVNAVVEAKKMWRELAVRRGVPLKIVECSCSDEAVHRQRLEARHRGLHLPEPTWEAVRARRAESTLWGEPTLQVDSTAPLGENVERVLRALRPAQRQ